MRVKHHEEVKNKRWAELWWSVDDVIAEAEARGLQITEKEAFQFMDEHTDGILEAMLPSAWEYIGQTLEANYGNTRRKENGK